MNKATFKTSVSRWFTGTLCSVIAIGLLFATGCKQDQVASPVISPPGTAAPVSPAAVPQGAPQPKLPTIKLWVGTNEVTAELAMTLNQIRTGMMWRTNMAEMDGMLFVFGEPHQVSFYMKNTVLPLSCAYIDTDGTILEIYDMKPLDETPIPSRSDQVLYVLEMNRGWFQRHGIKPGVVVATERGTMPQTFQRR